MNEILYAYECGIDDGFFRGDCTHKTSEWSAEQIHAYNRGYDHGVWMHCETLKEGAEQ